MGPRVDALANERRTETALPFRIDRFAEFEEEDEEIHEGFD